VIEQRLRDQHRTVLIGDDDVVRKHRNPAAADRLAPADEGQPGDRGRRREAVAPDRKVGAEHALDVAHHAVGDQRGNPALDHARAENVAEDAGIGDTHGIDHGNAAGRHGLDRRAGRNRRRPRLGRGEILAGGHEAQRKGRADQPGLAGPKRLGAAHPDVSQALLEQNGGDGGGRHAGQGCDGFGG
jgi:hypothetical protein